MHPIELILGPIQPIMSSLLAGAKIDTIPLSKYTIDHLCYRVSTIERYNEVKSILTSYGESLSVEVINGRPIATILLHTPLEYGEFKIECLELPSPKAGTNYLEGWEHAECAVWIPPREFLKIYTDITFDTDGLNRAINPDIRRVYGKYALKFHEHTLRYVVEVLQT